MWTEFVVWTNRVILLEIAVLLILCLIEARHQHIPGHSIPLVSKKLATFVPALLQNIPCPGNQIKSLPGLSTFLLSDH